MSDIEYITKDNAIQAIYSFPYVMRNTEVLDRIANDIRFTPSEDVAPVVHGKWAFQYSSTDPEPYYSFCSHCREPIKSTRAYKIYKFCPHCGAKMEEEVKK